MKNKIKKAETWYNNNAKKYEHFAQEVAQIIEKILMTGRIPYQSITQRIKEKESYLNKCKKDKYLDPVEEIMDLAGVRIIAYTNNDVKKICAIIEEQFKIDDNNSENKAEKIGEDKLGYLSVHYVAELSDERVKLPEYIVYKDFKCEIQVRTLLQHAWAEIEHDKNYKFSVTLPKDIKRRFYLLSGVLEMIDREFDNLSKEIDDYSEMVHEKTKQGDFDIEIDTESLSQYLLSKFENDERIDKSSCGIVNKSVIDELLRFGFKKITDIDQELTEKMITKILSKEKKSTYIGLLRDLMMILDVEKYFKVAYNGDWTGTNRWQIEVWEKNGIKNIEEYLIDAGIMIFPGKNESR